MQHSRLLTPTDWMPGPGERTSVKGSYGLKRCFHNSDSSFFPLLVFPFPRMQKALPAFLHLCSVLSSAFGEILLISDSLGRGRPVGRALFPLLFPFLGCNALFLSGYIVWRPSGMCLMHDANVMWWC